MKLVVTNNSPDSLITNRMAAPRGPDNPVSTVLPGTWRARRKEQKSAQQNSVKSRSAHMGGGPYDLRPPLKPPRGGGHMSASCVDLSFGPQGIWPQRFNPQAFGSQGIWPQGFYHSYMAPYSCIAMPPGTDMMNPGVPYPSQIHGPPQPQSTALTGYMAAQQVMQPCSSGQRVVEIYQGGDHHVVPGASYHDHVAESTPRGHQSPQPKVVNWKDMSDHGMSTMQPTPETAMTVVCPPTPPSPAVARECPETTRTDVTTAELPTHPAPPRRSQRIRQRKLKA